MRPIGFCTGAVARGDFRQGLRLLAARGLPAVEISAHRVAELHDLVSFLADRPHVAFSHVSVHGPSGFAREEEARLLDLLARHVPAAWPVIIHPDIVHFDEAWRALGPRVCFENMDRHKRLGQTCADMSAIFARFPEATFCFDIGHARQVDPTMREAASLLSTFRECLREVHFSEVDVDGTHRRVSREAQEAFRKVAGLIPYELPIILETDVDEQDIDDELQVARETLGG